MSTWCAMRRCCFGWRCRLDGVRYRWRAEADSPARLGLVAQDVRAVFPELVDVGPDGLLGITYTGLIAPLVEAVKELAGRMDAVERRGSAGPVEEET